VTTTPPTAAELAEIVSPAGVRPGNAKDSVATLVPALVVSPSSPEEVASVMGTANVRGWSVVVRGGGTKLGWGRSPRRCDLLLDTTRLDRLVEHEPGDLICVAGAGMRLEELQARVASALGYRQRLMLDPPQGTGATLGGLVATRAAGPLRTRYGTMRELLLGAQFVLADGTLARTGGKVVKNVAGYDIDKLLVGSLGSLAVVVEVALRLHPLSPASRTVLLQPTDPDEAGQFLTGLRRIPAVPSVAEAVWPERAVVVRLDSSEEGAQRQAERVAALHPRARILPEAEASRWLDGLAHKPWAGPGAVAGFSLPLAAITHLLELAEHESAKDQAFELALRGTIGVGEARLAPGAATVTRWRQAVEALGGHLELHRAPPELGQLGSDPTDPIARGLMSAVKRSFDPGDTLGSGHFEQEG
jgi:glycolate oxidase FAD binding subunit